MLETSSPILFITLILLPAASISETIQKSCPDTLACNSKECNSLSQNLLENLDMTTNPCENFYQFACGGYTKSKKIPIDKTQISTLSEMVTLVNNQLHAVLKEPIHDNEPHTLKLAKQLFGVCLNTSAIDENNLKTAKELLKKLDGWPVLEGNSWKENDFDWKKQMYKFRKYGFAVNKLLDVSVEMNAENSSQRIFIIDQADLPVNRFNLIQGYHNTIVQWYYKYLVDLSVIFGANRTVASSQMKEVINFMVELAKLTLPPEERRNFTAVTNIMNVAEIKKRFPQIDWIDFMNNIIDIPGIQIYDNDTVDVSSLEYVNKLERLLTQTRKRTQANYVMSVAVASIAYALNQDVRNREYKLLQDLSGTESKLPRWNECLEHVTIKLKVAIGALYARKFFKQSSKAIVDSMVSNLHLRLLKMLKEVDWMDEITRKEALEKASAVARFVGYPSEIWNNNKLDNYYEQLKPSKDYLEFMINIQKFDSDNKFRRIREEVQRGYWADNSAAHDVNAFYNLAENTINLPAGILQGMMFDVERPQAMNYGSIGFIIGHELTHGFDDMGKQINTEGELQNWWTEKTSDEYMRKAECIVNQYSNYTYKKLNLTLNGIITLGENIADNGGAKVAYETYQSWLNENGDDKCLPNLNFTHNQLFWIALANTWCTSERDAQLKMEMLTAVHPPAYFRVIGVVSNSKHFANDFQCALGSAMNPVKKCTFW
ncbi:hypothetical protein FQR65_LT14901 [Abscondita terminalis]|nr:hypothetical protein FQR65_LT14901 [Abscondita terminalis]